MTSVKGRRATSSRRRIAVVRLLALGTGVSVALVVARILHTGSSDAGGLVWNLVLAWVPFVLAVLVYDGHRRSAPAPLLLAGAALWLLFFPNAPYIVTDFTWLGEWTGVPVWFDALVLSAAAATGLALGFVSLYLVQSVARRLLGPRPAWLLVVSFLALGSIGVYLGRAQRWNSWDVFTQPYYLLSEIGERLVDPLAYGRAITVTALFTVFLTAAYAAFYRVTDIALSDDD
jgi:uncharacterized membrane protein